MGYLYVIFCQVIVGSSYPIAKEAIDTIPEWILACSTLAIASILLMPLASKFENTNWKSFGMGNWLKVGIQSLCACVLYTVFLFFALSHASATVSGIFNGLSPACVFILSPLFTQEKLNFRKGLAIVLAIAAVLVVSISSTTDDLTTDWIGIVFLLLSVLSVSLFTVISKRFAVNLQPITAAAGVCFTGFLITIPFCIYQIEISNFSYQLFFKNGNLSATLYYAVFVWAIAYLLWYYGIPKVSAIFGGVAQAIVPISSMASAVIFFGEKVHFSDILGIVFIILSVIIAVWAESIDIVLIHKKEIISKI